MSVVGMGRGQGRREQVKEKYQGRKKSQKTGEKDTDKRQIEFANVLKFRTIDSTQRMNK